MGEIRTIEKKGVLNLTLDDRKSLTLLITTEVIQRPYNQYLNTKSNPYTSFYGYACVMAQEYVINRIELRHVRQIIIDSKDYETQLGYQIYCNSRSILSAITGTGTIDTKVKFPARLATQIRFKLEPGVILTVQKETTPMVTCGGDGVEQTDYSPPLPTYGEEPIASNPDGSSANPTFKPSLPYNGIDDFGNTYYPTSVTTKTKFWLVGTYVNGVGAYASQTAEPSGTDAFLVVNGNASGITLVQGSRLGNGPDGQSVYQYKLSNGQTFNGGWKPTPSLAKRLTQA